MYRMLDSLAHTRRVRMPRAKELLSVCVRKDVHARIDAHASHVQLMHHLSLPSLQFMILFSSRGRVLTALRVPRKHSNMSHLKEHFESLSGVSFKIAGDSVEIPISLSLCCKI